jgi:crotonobetainyl-CoA:carnitine CoA-transferase CaiB-like acyl-CoA transferase
VTSATDSRPLAGIRVLELGQLIAGPFAACVLGYFGADVIKVEPPGSGDALRNWRVLDDTGTSFWWRSMARNKRCVTINLREQRGRDLAHDLAMSSDVVLENFRPGTMEKWGLGPQRYQLEHPQLVYTRVSGYGQSGPYSARPGFASACEGFGGFRYINGYPDEAPVRPNLSMGDTLAAMNAVIGTLMALIGRNRIGGKGQVVDVAIYESVFNMLESVVPEFDGAGVVREPSGTTLTGIVPTNTYRCVDSRYVVIGGNGDSIFKRLMHAIGRADLADDIRLSDNAGRVRHQSEVDGAISAWTSTLNADEVRAHLDCAGVPNGPINSVREIMNDQHFQARGMFESVVVGEQELKIPAITPRLCDTPGRTDFAGPELGAHNDEVFRDVLGLTSLQIQHLSDSGII